MGHSQSTVRSAIAIVLSIACFATGAAGQRRAQMQVSCVVLPHISLQLNSQKPVYGDSAATLVIEPGQLELTGETNDLHSSEFVLSVSSDAPAVVNGVDVVPGQTVEVGRYHYGVAIPLTAAGAMPIRLTASR